MGVIHRCTGVSSAIFCFLLRQNDEFCRDLQSNSHASIYKWKAKFGGMDVSEAKRLRTLEDENTRLKRLLADAMLDNAAL